MKNITGLLSLTMLLVTFLYLVFFINDPFSFQPNAVVHTFLFTGCFSSSITFFAFHVAEIWKDEYTELSDQVRNGDYNKCACGNS